MTPLELLAMFWADALRRRPGTRVILVDQDTGVSKILPQAAGELIQAGLQALAERVDVDPMAAGTLAAKSAGTLVPGPMRQQ